MATDQKEKDYNPSQEDYETKFDNTGSTSTSGHDSDDAANLSTRESKPDGSHDDVDLSPSEQAKIDQMEAGLRENNLYDPNNTQQHHKPSLQSRIKGLANTRGKKAGWIGGGIVTFLIGSFLTLFPVLGPVHIFSNLMDHNFEFNDSFRRNRTGRIVDSILNRNRTNRNLRDTPFSTKADLIEFERFEARMQSSGWSFSYDADGRATGLIDPDGNRVGLDNTSRSEFRQRVQPLIDDNVPAWRMNKRIRTRALISTFTGPRKSFNWTDLFKRNKTAEPDFGVAKFKKEAGIDNPTIDADGRVRDVDADGNSTDTNSRTVGDEALDATIEAKLNGATDAEAVKAGNDVLNKSLMPDGSGRTSIIFGTVVVSCIAYSINENQIYSSYERFANAMRYGATFMLAVNEMQQGGNIDVGEVGELFNDYNNHTPVKAEVTVDGEAVLDDNGEPYDYEKSVGSFAETAAWQRATGSSVNGEEINPEYRVLPDQNTGGVINSILDETLLGLATIGGFIAKIPGFGTICTILQSAFGFVIGLALDFVEGFAALAACIGTAGGGCAALTKFLIVEGLYEGGARMLQYGMAGSVAFLMDNPRQATAVLDQSLSLISTDESRTAMPVNNRDYNAQVLAFKQERSKDLPFSERYFALDNANSMAANLARFKMGLGNYNIPQTIAKIFSLPGNSIVAAATSQNVYAQAGLDFDNYGFQKYSYSNEYLDVDPYDLADEVSDMIEDDTSIVSNAGEVDNSSNLARDFAVLCMGYNPDTEAVNKDYGTQMLPMFSDPEALGVNEASRRNDLFQALCIDAANSEEHKNFYAKIGRFIDDIEIVSSIVELTGKSVLEAKPSSPASGGGGGSGSGDLQPAPTPTPPEICDPNEITPGPGCIN